MPYSRSTLPELFDQASADIQAALPGTQPLLAVANLRVLAAILAEGFNSLYGYLDYIARQGVPFTAVDEALEGWAALRGVVRKPATKATYPATFAGSVGAILPAGTPVQRGDGVAFVVLADGVVGGGGTVTVNIEAAVAGSAANTAAGTEVALAQAVAGISNTGTTAAGAAGADVEATAAFRSRMLQVYANPPQGGAKSDYEEWAGQVAGVTRAWCAPLASGPGTVGVYFMMDEAEAAFGGFPQGSNGVATDEARDVAATGDQLAVADYVYPLRPVTALVYALAPAANTVVYTINLIGVTAEQKASADAAIDAVFLAHGDPREGVIHNSLVEAAIASIAGTEGFVITGIACDHGAVAPGAAGNITSDLGYVPVRGVTVWTP